MKKICIILLSFILSGCSGGSNLGKEIPYENIEAQDSYEAIIYFRNCNIAHNFNSARIPIYKDGIIKFSDDYKWNGKLKNLLFAKLAAVGSRNKFKFTQLPNFNFVDIFIEQIFFDCDAKKMVINCTVNFNGRVVSFYITEHVETVKNYNVLLNRAAIVIIDFVRSNKNVLRIEKLEIPSI